MRSLIRQNLTSTSKATEARWVGLFLEPAACQLMTRLRTDRVVPRHELSSAPHCPQDESSCALLYDEHISYVSSFALCHVYARSMRSVSIPTRALLSAPPIDASLTRAIPGAARWHTPPMTAPRPLPCPLQPDVMSKPRANLLSTHPTPHPLPTRSAIWVLAHAPALLGPLPLSTSSAHHTLALTAPKSTAKSAAESTQSQESMSADEWATAVGGTVDEKRPTHGLPPVAKGRVLIRRL
ncbi:hypothetical protein B0H10DRAFT_1937716 [Mycena sp. CBHHK59/15]|nr:hypothetical protein B0H10DRAFT_1937716 [Mycena sp. CBHHK59/15]